MFLGKLRGEEKWRLSLWIYYEVNNLEIVIPSAVVKGIIRNREYLIQPEINDSAVTSVVYGLWNLLISRK